MIYQGSFDVDRMLRLVERERVTNWAAVPTMANRLLEHEDLSRYDLSSVTAFALSAAPSSAAFQDRLREKVPFARSSLVDSYGQTESATAISVATPRSISHSSPPEPSGGPSSGGSPSRSGTRSGG